MYVQNQQLTLSRESSLHLLYELIPLTHVAFLDSRRLLRWLVVLGIVLLEPSSLFRSRQTQTTPKRTIPIVHEVGLFAVESADGQDKID